MKRTRWIASAGREGGAEDAIGGIAGGKGGFQISVLVCSRPW